jgi:hypothetical protein
MRTLCDYSVRCQHGLHHPTSVWNGVHYTSPRIIDTGIPGIDLHDLNALRSRSLHFIHDLVNSLRESGVRRKNRRRSSTTEAFSVPNLGPGLVQTHAIQFTVVPDLYLPLTSGHERNSTFST